MEDTKRYEIQCSNCGQSTGLQVSYPKNVLEKAEELGQNDTVKGERARQRIRKEVTSKEVNRAADKMMEVILSQQKDIERLTDGQQTILEGYDKLQRKCDDLQEAAEHVIDNINEPCVCAQKELGYCPVCNPLMRLQTALNRFSDTSSDD